MTEIFWQAVKNKDAGFNGVFVYGVRSTGIFCRPSCGARQPLPENVSFFESPEAAEAKGFRACRRCRPKELAVDPQVKMVAQVCELLDSDEPMRLEQLGAELGVSPAHLQKTFKEIIGVSPKKFAGMKRLERLKSELRKGTDVSGAIYEAGFNSSSRAYENVSEKLGMTPATYARGGKNMEIEYTVTDCDLGKMLVARTPKGICAVTFGDEEGILEENLRNEYRAASIVRSGANLKDYVDAILASLAGTAKSLDLPLDIQATAFQMRVWDTLRKIAYGTTVSYQQVAEQLGSPKSVRAVARACASNRVAIVIPCHRVVASNGNLSGYRWGVERKKKILENESAQAESKSGAGV